MNRYVIDASVATRFVLSEDLYEEARTVWYDGMNVIKDGAADYDVPEKWPDSPQYWGYDSWDEVTAYCIAIWDVI